MKVVFLFMSKGNATPGTIKTDAWKYQECSPAYQKIHGDEGYFTMFKSLLDQGTITDLKVFFESNNHPGRAQFVEGAENWVIPEIRLVEEYIDDDTVIFVRGGFKHWHDFLLKYKGKNWLMIYAANTGRDKWTWWDIVFDDLLMANEIDRHGRYRFPFIKPTNENTFGIMVNKLKYDICIGASNIHDKKGQWRTVKLLEVFKSKYGYYPTAVMPGGLRRSTKTLEMLKSYFFSNEVECPGTLSRSELSKLFASCRIFMHLGAGGQNDRSILEAHCCGLPVCFSNTSRFTPLLKHDNFSTYIFDGNDSYDKWAEQLYDILHDYQPGDKIERHYIYKERMGYEQVALPYLSILFSTLAGTRPSGESGQAAKERCIELIKEFQLRRDFEKRNNE